MAVLELTADVEKYAAVLLRDPTDYGALPGFEGRVFTGGEWPNLVGTLSDHPRGNFFYLCPGALAVDDKARQAIDRLLPGRAQFLPITLAKHCKAFVLNLLTVIDCLDTERSDVVLIPSSNKILTVRRYTFFEERLPACCLFKIPQLVRSAIFATEGLVTALSEFGLTGLAVRRLT